MNGIFVILLIGALINTCLTIKCKPLTNLDDKNLLDGKIKAPSDVQGQSPYTKIDCPSDNENSPKKCVVLDSKDLDLTGLSDEVLNVQEGNTESAADFPTSPDENFLKVLACYQREKGAYYLVVEDFDFSFSDILNEMTNIESQSPDIRPGVHFLYFKSMVESVHSILENIDKNFKLNPMSIVAIKSSLGIKFTLGWTFLKGNNGLDLMNLFDILKDKDFDGVNEAIQNINKEIQDLEREMKINQEDSNSAYYEIQSYKQKISFYEDFSTKNSILNREKTMYSVLALAKAFFLLKNPKFATTTSWTPIQIAVIKITSEFDNPDDLTDFNLIKKPECDSTNPNLTNCVERIVKEAVSNALAGSDNLTVLKNLVNEIAKLKEEKFPTIKRAKDVYPKNSALI